MSSTAGPSLAAADLFTVKGLVAVITGGATGIGLMMAKALEQNGAKVYIVGRRKELLEKVAKEEATHGNIIPVQGDVTSKPDLERIAAHLTAEAGHVDLLVCNAGVTGPRFGAGISVAGSGRPAPGTSLADLQRDLLAVDPATFAETFSVNVGGVYFTIAAFLPLLDAANLNRTSSSGPQGAGGASSQVVVTSSIGGFNRVPAAHYAYGASKAAVTHMAKQFATTFAGYGIRFNVIAPGLYPSEMTTGSTEAIAKMTDEEKSSRVSPLGRIGSTEDMAGCILWLASKAGAWIDGMVVVTDGGRLSVLPSTY